MSRVLLGVNRGVPFPVSPRVIVMNPKNIVLHIDDLDNFEGIGNYYQALN